MNIFLLILIVWIVLGSIGAALLAYDHYRVGLDIKVSDVFITFFGAVVLGPIFFAMGLSVLKVGEIVLIRGKNARG